MTEGATLESSVSSLEKYEHLLEPHELAEQGLVEQGRLSLELVDPNPNNPRRELIEVDALADNIRELGLMQPVLVRRAGERFELLGGHRRLAAFRLLRDVKDPLNDRWRAIPAVVVNADDDLADRMLISGQVHIRAWSPKEEAAALERLLIGGRNMKQIGEALNRAESWTSKRLRVYSDSVLSGYVQSGQLGRSVAEELLQILDVDVKHRYAERAVAENWGQDFARGQVRALRLDRQLREVARRARDLLVLLSSVDASALPAEAKDDLWKLRGRIIALGRGPVIPPLEQVGTPRPEKRGRPRRAGYKPRL